jgi:hypothetical protein
MAFRHYLIFGVILTAVALVIIYYPSEKKRIRKVIDGCIESVLSENADNLMGHISFNYSDDRGGSYIQIKKRMELIFNRFDDFDIAVDIMNIRVEEGKAVADLKVNMIASHGTDRGYLIGDAAGPEDMKIYLEKSPYEWKVYKVENAGKR